VNLTALPALTLAERREVDALARACRPPGEDEMPLYYAPEAARGGAGRTPNTQILYREDPELLGFAAVPPEPDAEVILLVHPAHRRRGIGRLLLEAAREECRARGDDELVVVSLDSLPEGTAFARAMGGCHELSEYRMELDTAALSQAARGDALQVSEVGREHADSLTAVQAVTSGTPPDRAWARLEAWLASGVHRFFLAHLEGEPIGSIRVNAEEGAGLLYLCTFGVLPAYRRRGFGRELLVKTTRALLAERPATLRLEVAVDNPDALGLYRAAGFREIATFHYYRLAVHT
jgi:ribosomal protein S18 acetylase RimI-like enzyme